MLYTVCMHSSLGRRHVHNTQQSLSLLGHYTNWWCNVVYSSHAVAKAHSEVMKTQFSKFQMIYTLLET